MKAFKFKLKVSSQIKQKLDHTLDLCRELYNAALQERREAYRLNQVSLTYKTQANQLPAIKEYRPEFAEIYSQILQDVLKRLEKTFQAFFGRIKRGEKAGFPRFKGADRYDSFTFPQANGSFRLEGNNLYLSKIGKMKVKLSRKVLGKAKICTIKREVSGWFVIFTVEDEKELLPKTGKQVGIDVGIESFLTLSNGQQIENFKYFEASQKKLRVAQRAVAKKKKGSKSRRKAVLRLRKIHRKIRNQRNDLAHKLSTRIVKEFDVIAIEDLNIKGLAKGILAKQIHDAAWSSFFHKLSYKAESAGKKLIKVNPSGTSQKCLCGARVEKALSQRWHKCRFCGYENHRDIVSAQIVLQRAVGQTVETPTWAVTSCVVSESPTITASV
jgi:putative transposase